MTATRLRSVYIEELNRALRPPVHKSVNAAQIRAMLHRAHDGDPSLCEEPDEKTWIWSDLHLGHETSIGAFGRPFHTAQAADKAMQRAWVERVAEDDTIVCLGDITVDGCLQPHHMLRWQQAPGRKVLVLGNHDVDPINRVEHLDIQQQALALVAPGDPPLLQTHVPLIEMPFDTVNVHGHIHEKQPPTPNHHINVRTAIDTILPSFASRPATAPASSGPQGGNVVPVSVLSVEQLDYAPANLKDVRRLARRLLERRKVPAGKRTRRQLDIVNATMP